MSDLTNQRERLHTQRPTPWEQLPDFPLYMDQMLSYMDRQLIRFDGDGGLTAAMVNNYTKSGLVPRADGKKYTRSHLAYLTAVCVLKQVLSTKDIALVLDAQRAQGDLPERYASFCASLDRALNLMGDMMEGYPSEGDAADAAVHFALLSYAAGLASSRYVQLLREKRQSTAESTEKKPRDKRRAARTEKENA